MTKDDERRETIRQELNRLARGNLYYDRQGNPIGIGDWALIFEGGEGERRVAEDQVGPFWVSTVWLGLDHQYGDGPPLIFETMVFDVVDPVIEEKVWTVGGKTFRWTSDSSWRDLDLERYTTEEQALEGHKRMVDKIHDLCVEIDEIVRDVTEEAPE